MILYIDHSKQELTFAAIGKQSSIPSQITFAFPAIIIQDELFKQLQNNKSIQKSTLWTSYTGYTIKNGQQMENAISIYKETTNNGTYKVNLKNGATEIHQFNAKQKIIDSHLKALVY